MKSVVDVHNDSAEVELPSNGKSLGRRMMVADARRLRSLVYRSNPRPGAAKIAAGASAAGPASGSVTIEVRSR
jgi:hypothetical protein